nr:MAG TPA: nucelotide kinase [Caudoviricetes sp.]
MEMVNHPEHYNPGALETINVIEEYTKDLTGIEAFDTANIIKYVCRWNRKNGVEDLRKLVWYAEHLINHIETKGEM